MRGAWAGRVAAVLGAVVVAVALGLAAPGPAAGQAGGERILSYDAVLTVEPDGDLRVQEEIAYDFGGAERHGLERRLPVRFHYDGTHDRVHPVDDVAVRTSPGTPDDLDVETSGSELVVRVGDPDETITGAHTYTLNYVVRGSLNGFDDHDELYWNAVGHAWDVPIDDVRVRLDLPAAPTEIACFAGPLRSNLPCGSAQADATGASFTEDGLDPGEGLTIVAALPKGVVPEPAPILEERWAIGRAFSATPATLGAAGAVAAAVLAGIVALVRRHGRDEAWVGGAVDVAFGNDSGQRRRVRLFERHRPPVEFVPPDGLRPGQVGTLVDEVAHPLDVTATIIDLAVRGYLRIEEVPGRKGPEDWVLHRLRPSDDRLHEYERRLHDGLFEDGDEVALSELRNHFAPRLKRVQDALYDDVVAQGWFPRRPDHVRAAWLGMGVVALVVAIGALIAAAAFTRWAMVAVPPLVGAIALLALHSRMPHRTARGTGTLRRAIGFRRFIEESEADRARFAERRHLFSEYLPYAVVFGATERWAKAFEGLQDELPEPTWYVGAQPFHPIWFASSIGSFSTTTAGTVVSTPPAASGGSGFGGGGFSGGGGGGGGGGSW